MDNINKGYLIALTTFNVMLTPKIITLVYWIGLLGILLSGFAAIAASGLVTAIGIWVGGGVGWRIWCELMMVFFKMNENLQRLADHHADIKPVAE